MAIPFKIPGLTEAQEEELLKGFIEPEPTLPIREPARLPEAEEITPLPPETKEITADLLAEGREITPVPEPKPDLTIVDETAGLENLMELFREQAETAKTRQEEALKAQEVRVQKLEVAREKEVSAEERRAEVLEEFKVPETMTQIRESIATAKGIRDNLVNIVAERDAQLLAKEGLPISMVAIRGEQALVERAYNSRIAAESARLGAETAYTEALRGNVSDARQFASDAVNALIYEQDRDYKMLQDTYDMNKDLIDDLEAEYKDAFDNALKMALTIRDEKKEEVEDIMGLQLDAATRGIRLNLIGMTKDEAAKTYSEAVARVEALPPTIAPPTSFKEWQLAGGATGTGMTYGEFIAAGKLTVTEVRGIVTTEAEERFTSELLSHPDTPYLDGNVYLGERKKYIEKGGSMVNFDRMFAHMLSSTDRDKYGITERLEIDPLQQIINEALRKAAE